MKTFLVTALMVALAAPVCAQRTSRLHLGLAVSSTNGPLWEETMAGAYAGVLLDVRDHLRLGVLYVQKGGDGIRVHSIEAPVLYKHRIAEDTHLLVGAAPSYGNYLDVGAVIGLAVRGEDRPIGVEVAYVHGLVPDLHCCTDGVTEPGHRVLRIGLEIPLTNGGKE